MGLVEVPDTVDVRRDPVAQLHHLPGDLRVKALGWVHEGRVAEAHQIERGRDDRDAEGDPAHRACPSGDLQRPRRPAAAEELGERLLEIAAVARLQR